MTRGFCPSALGLMDNAQDIAMIRDFRKCEKYLTLPYFDNEYELKNGKEKQAWGGYETEIYWDKSFKQVIGYNIDDVLNNLGFSNEEILHFYDAYGSMSIGEVGARRLGIGISYLSVQYNQVG